MTSATGTVIALSVTLMLAVSPQAAAAPSGGNSVQDTVSELESAGHKVILNKVGSAPVDQCVVTAVRPGRDVTELRRNQRNQTVERVLYTTVYVDVSC